MDSFAETEKVNYVKLRHDYVKRIVDEHDWDKRKGAQTFRSTLDTLTLSASEYARQQGFSASTFDVLLDQCLDIVLDYSLALNLSAYDDDKPLKGWYHRQSIAQDILNDHCPEIEHETVAQMVTNYLSLPFRNQSFERLLVDMLMAQEIYAYGRQVLPQLKAHTVTGFLKYRLIGAVGWFVFAWFVYAVFDKNWTTPIFWIFIAQSVLALVLAMRPSKPGKLLSKMVGTYFELNGGGPFSGKHIEARVKAANEAGVIWPASLYVLLDDINERGGRF